MNMTYSNVERSLLDALLKTLENDMGKVAKKTLVKDIPEVAKNSIRSFSVVYSYSKGLTESFVANGFNDGFGELRDDIKATGKYVWNAPLSIYNSTKVGIRSIQKEFNGLKTNQERAIHAIKLSCYITSLSAGAVLGNSLPDKDITKLGIGRHRDFMFHSALIAGSITITARFLCNILEESEKHMGESDSKEALEFLIKNLRLAAFGGAIGAAVHIGIDGTIQGTKAVTTPVSNTFIHGTILDDNAYLCSSALMNLDIGRSEQK